MQGGRVELKLYNGRLAALQTNSSWCANDECGKAPIDGRALCARASSFPWQTFDLFPHGSERHPAAEQGREAENSEGKGQGDPGKKRKARGAALLYIKHTQSEYAK